MTTDTRAPADVLTRRDLAPIVTEDLSENDLDAFIQGLPEERIPQAIIRIADFRKALKALESALEQRFATTELRRQVWIDPATGLRYAWMAGSRSAKIPDVAGLFTELNAAGLSGATIAAAVSPSGIRVTVLREAVAGTEREKEVERILKEHRKYESGPEHLKCLDREEE